MKGFLKKVYLKYIKNIHIDRKSKINIDVKSNSNKNTEKIAIVDSICNFNSIGEGCVISESRCYGNIF